MPSWSKGFTKETHPSVMKISRTMKEKKINNFSMWMKNTGRTNKAYLPLLHSSDLAEYIGVVLGDGNIEKFPRTERMVISANSNNKGFIQRYANLTEKLFNKKPTLMKSPDKDSVRISFYQNKISERLGIPTGDKSNLNFNFLPCSQWIWRQDEYIIGFLRGLFEAEGSLSIHLPTSTYNFQFCNLNQSLLDAVERGLRQFRYNPEIRKTFIRLRKKAEVFRFKDLIKFRIY